MRCIAFAVIVSMNLLPAVPVIVAQGADVVDAVATANANRLRAHVRQTFDSLLLALRDQEKGRDDLVALWATMASVEKGKYEINFALASQMSKETWDSLKGNFGDSGGQPFKSLMDWHEAHVPLFDAVFDVGGPRMAQIKGDMNAVIKDLESMIDGAPAFRDKFHEWFAKLGNLLTIYEAAIETASTVYAITHLEDLLKGIRKPCTSLQKIYRNRQGLVEQWLLSVKPGELDEEITDVVGYLGNKALTQRLPQDELPEVLRLMIEELEKTMIRYENLYEKADEAWVPFLSGSFYDDIKVYRGLSPSKFLEPIDVLEKRAGGRKVEIIKTSKLATEIQSAWDYAKKLKNQYLGTEPVITKQYDALKKLALDCPPAIAKQILEMAAEVAPSKEEVILEKIAGLLQGGGGETFEGLLADATAAAADPNARSRLKNRFDKLLSGQSTELSALQRQLKDLRYQARVLLEKAQNLASKRR